MSIFSNLDAIKEVDKSYYRMIIALVAGLGIVALIPVFFCIKSVALENTLAETARSLAPYQISSTRTNVPSEERLTYLSKQLNTFEEEYRSIKPAFSYTVTPFATPLDFKEQLFSTKQRLQDKARAAGIAFPEQYGMETYERRLPQEKELPELALYLSFFDEIYSALIALPAAAIHELSFGDVVEKPFSYNDTERYRLYTISVSFDASFHGIMTFFNALSSSPHLYAIDRCVIVHSEAENAKPGTLTATCTFHVFALQVSPGKKGAV